MNKTSFDGFIFILFSRQILLSVFSPKNLMLFFSISIIFIFLSPNLQLSVVTSEDSFSTLCFYLFMFQPPWLGKTSGLVVIKHRVSEFKFFFFFFLLFLKINLIYFFLIGGLLIHNIVLVSAIHQHESAICIHMSPPS